MRALELTCPECETVTLIHPERQAEILAEFDPRYVARVVTVCCSQCGRTEWGLRARSVGFHRQATVVQVGDQ